MPKSCHVTKLLRFYTIIKKNGERGKWPEPGGSGSVCATEFDNIGLC